MDTNSSGSKSVSVEEMLTLAGLTKDMTEDEVSELLSIAEERSYTRGTLIVQEDSKSRDLYLLRQGRISVRIALPSNLDREEIVYSMRDGQIFGELSLVDGCPRSATIRAEDDVVTLRFDFDNLSQLLESKPRIGYILMRNIAVIISARMRNTNMLWRNSLIW